MERSSSVGIEFVHWRVDFVLIEFVCGRFESHRASSMEGGGGGRSDGE